LLARKSRKHTFAEKRSKERAFCGEAA
jgi:hypothetical protein